MEITQIQSLRTAFLLKLYDFTGGDRWQNPIMFEIGNQLGIDRSMTELISDYLDQKGLIEINTKDRDISITTLGIDEAERYFNAGDSTMTKDELKISLEEINNKLDLLSLGQEIIYEDIMDKLESNGKIQRKDLKLVLVSSILSKGLDSIKIAQMIDFLK